MCGGVFLSFARGFAFVMINLVITYINTLKEKPVAKLFFDSYLF